MADSSTHAESEVRVLLFEPTSNLNSGHAENDLTITDLGRRYILHMIRYAHTNIISQDWQALVRFYVDVFGCEVVPPLRDQSGEWLAKGTGVPDARLHGAHVRLPGHGANGPTLEIFQYEDIEDAPPVHPHQRGYGHLAFEVENVAAMMNKVLDGGGSRLGEIVQKDIPEAGRITFVYVRDPEGNIIELQQWSDQ